MRLPSIRISFYSALLSTSLMLIACGGNNKYNEPTTPPPLYLEFVAGELGGQGNADGARGRFTSPQGIAVGLDGTIYVSESTDEPIRRIDADGIVSSLANTAKNKFWVEKFFKDVPPSRSLAIDGANNIYYAVENECQVHKVTASGETSIYAGQATCGFADGPKNEARFGKIASIAIDSHGSLYLTDPDNFLIRKIDRFGIVSTLAGRFNESGLIDGPKESAKFSSPLGITVDHRGTVYVTDNLGTKLRRVTPDGTVTTLNPQWEKTMIPIEFRDLHGGIITDNFDNIYLVEGTQLLKILPNGDVRALAGTRMGNNIKDGLGEAAEFGAYARTYNGDGVALWTPGRLSIDQKGILYFADTVCHCIRKISPEGVVTTIAGIKPPNSWENLDGQGNAARFFIRVFDIDLLGESSLEINYSLRMASNRNVIVTGRGWAGSKKVARQVSPSGMVTSIEPWGVSNPDAISKNGNKYWFSGKDSGESFATVSGEVFMQDSKGEIRTLAGRPQIYGTPKDGVGWAAEFFNITALTLDNADNIYVIDRDRVPSPTPWEIPGRDGYLVEGGLVRKITPTGVVTTIAGSLDERGHVDGPGNKARFHAPMSIAGDQYGNIFVADTLNHVIRKISPDGMVSTFAGTPQKTGFADGRGNKASFNTPNIIVFDSHGNLYVADSGNFLIRKITPAGAVTTIAGTPGSRGVIPGKLPASLSFIAGLTIDDQDTLYIFSEGAVLKIEQRK